MQPRREFFADHLWPALLGVLAFSIVVGVRAIDPTNIAWLGDGDAAQHYLGWLFYRQAPWVFPLGGNPGYGLEIANSVIYADAIPLLAFVFKPFASVLPTTFQYIGLWLLICFVAQSWIAWQLAGLFTDRRLVQSLVTAILVFSPPMLWRLHDHSSLAGHFLILAALYLYFRPGNARRLLCWAPVLVIAALVHAYLLGMAGGIWVLDVATRRLRGEFRTRAAFVEAIALFAAVGVACWQAGYFGIGTGAVASGYGYYRMNLLALFDADGWSYLLGDIPQAEGEYEGFNYLGFGLVVLAVFAIVMLALRRPRIGAALRRHPLLLPAAGAVLLFALTNRIGIGSYEFEFPLPEKLYYLASVFRASGRMFWPVFYLVALGILYAVVRYGPPRLIVAVLSVALVLQIADTRAGWRPMRQRFDTEPSQTWPQALTGPFWEQAAARYTRVRHIAPKSMAPHWAQLSFFAGTHGMTTDAVYLARVSRDAMRQSEQNAAARLRDGRYEADTLFILDNRSVQAARATLNDDDILVRVDGLNVLAPGWNRCTTCMPVASIQAP